MDRLTCPITSESVRRSSAEAVALARTILDLVQIKKLWISGLTQYTDNILLVAHFCRYLRIRALHSLLLYFYNLDRSLVHDINNLFQVLDSF
jgi:hypothetical protein